jgi:predicted AAA+ superfamily ATPase
LAQGFEPPHYWTLQGNKAEVDFLIPYGLTILPIEVKSDERISGKSFAVYDSKYHPSLRVRFSLRNLKQDGNLLNIPIFLADWLKEIIKKWNDQV